MALAPNELFSSVDRGPHPRLNALYTKIVTFASGTALLPIGTPVCLDTATGFYGPFEEGGATGRALIRGFVYEKPLQLVDGYEVLGNILWRGTVHRDDVTTAAILLVLGGSATAADVDVALRASTPTLRELGIDVVGLTLVP